MKYVLNVQLGPNFMTEDPDDFRGYPVSNGSYNVDDIIRLIKEDGVETSEATLKSSITRFNKKSAELAASGRNVNTGLVYLRPMVKGRFYDTVWDPEKHSLYVAATQGSVIREALADVEVRILGEKGEAMQLFTITVDLPFIRQL
ncbi:DNA-binding domain-containing protein [Thermophagus sp. OGC60D27]|uniref:DNA-binding domain-containing protein n=1 Tax=Thermophagus sp. OGC60D27 TaxID=3458415 RepID=UPI004037904C